MFCKGRKQAMTKFILFVNLDIVDRNSAPEEFACIWLTCDQAIFFFGGGGGGGNFFPPPKKKKSRDRRLALDKVSELE